MLIITSDSILLYMSVGMFLSLIFIVFGQYIKSDSIYYMLDSTVKVYFYSYIFIILLLMISGKSFSHYNYIEGVTKIEDIKESYLLPQGKYYYISHPSKEVQVIEKIELNEDSDDIVYITNIMDDRRVIPLFTLRNKVNILYANNELYKELKEGTLSDKVLLNDYIHNSD